MIRAGCRPLPAHLESPVPEEQVTSLTTLSREITRKLTRRIVDETYPPGSKLPTERELAAEFNVTRHVIREALKRLEALGLVRIRQGSGILVEDLQLTGGTELFNSLLTREDGTTDVSFLRDMLEFRAQIGQTAIRLAAKNRTEAELAELKALVEVRAGVLDDLPRLNEINAQLFQIIARATHNRIYQLVFNTIGKVFVELRPSINVHPDNIAKFQEMLEQMVQAIEEQDEEMAALLAARHRNMLRKAIADYLNDLGYEGGERLKNNGGA